MSGQGFSSKQLEQPGLVMDSKIESICSDIKKIKNCLDHLEQDVKAIKECPTIKKELK